MAEDESSDPPVFQHETLVDDEGVPIESVSAAARKMVADSLRAAEAAKVRYEATVISQPNRERVQIATALEELRKIQDTAAWGIRMLVEMSGIERRESNETEARRKYPSQREMVDAGGISLATVHSWIHNPAVAVDGNSGPGTLPRPGQTNHGRVAHRPRYDSDREDYDE